MTATRLRKFVAGHSAGQALTEFAGVASAFLLILFAIMEVGYAVYTYNTIAEAAQEAARYGIAHPPASSSSSDITAASSGVQTAAQAAAPGLALTTSQITVSWPTDSANSSNEDVLVQITYPFTINIPFFRASLSLTSTSQMMVSTSLST